MTDPLFGNPILRVTDALTDLDGDPTLGANGHGNSYHTTSAADHNTWNLGSTYFYVMNTGGSTVPFSFNATTLSASTLPATTYSPDSTGHTSGPRIIQFRAESDWSFTNQNWLYGVWNGSNPETNLHQVYRYDISNDSSSSGTNPYTQLLDLGTLGFDLNTPTSGNDPETLNAYGPYIHYIAVSFPDTAGTYGQAHGERVLALFGSNEQDFDYLIAVFDDPGCFFPQGGGLGAEPQADFRLLLAALRKAFAERQPAPGLVHHSIRGNQYASTDYAQLLQQHGVLMASSRR